MIAFEFDIVIRVRFLSRAEGGRKTSVQGDFYSCPMFLAGEAFDCRLLLYGRVLELGEFHEVPVKFLYRENALSKLELGMDFRLWEGRDVAEGRVIGISRA